MRPHALAALIGTAALASVTWAGCGTDVDSTATDPAPGKGTRSTPPDRQASEPAPSASSSNGTTTTVPVYFVGETPQGPRLYREFRRVTGDPLGEALALLASGDVADPDYRSFVPEGDIVSVEHDEAAGLIVVELADDAWEAPADGMDEGRAQLAVQQVVYTLQGGAQSRDPVELRVDGTAGEIFGFDSSGGIGHAPLLETLALVSVTAPEEGQAVSGTFTAGGVASSFEATVPWEVRQDGRVVAEGFATAEGWMDRLYPWQTEVDVSGLAPGEYEFVALTGDPSGGGEGAGPTEDSKTITVE